MILGNRGGDAPVMMGDDTTSIRGGEDEGDIPLPTSEVADAEVNIALLSDGLIIGDGFAWRSDLSSLLFPGDACEKRAGRGSRVNCPATRFSKKERHPINSRVRSKWH